MAESIPKADIKEAINLSHQFEIAARKSCSICYSRLPKYANWMQEIRNKVLMELLGNRKPRVSIPDAISVSYEFQAKANTYGSGVCISCYNDESRKVGWIRDNILNKLL